MSEDIKKTSVYSSAFTIESLVNTTDNDFTCEILSLGVPTHPVKHSVSVPAHQSIQLSLSFGRQEHEYIHPVGYVFTNVTSDKPFKTLVVKYEYSEDPLVALTGIHQQLPSLPFIHYWALYCDGQKISTYQGFEHVCTLFSIEVARGCQIAAHKVGTVKL